MGGDKELTGQEGQSTVEFALTLILLLAYVFFFIQLALVFAWGNYVHYATFMAARAFQSAGVNRQDQADRAMNVMALMVKRGKDFKTMDRFPMIARGEGGDGEAPGVQIQPPPQFNPAERNYSWMQGVRYTFRSRLFMLPLAGRRGPNTPNSVTLTSESWLGREPVFEDCLGDIKKGSGDQVVQIDNGC